MCEGLNFDIGLSIIWSLYSFLLLTQVLSSSQIYKSSYSQMYNFYFFKFSLVFFFSFLPNYLLKFTQPTLRYARHSPLSPTGDMSFQRAKSSSANEVHCRYMTSLSILICFKLVFLSRLTCCEQNTLLYSIPMKLVLHMA